MLGEGLGVGSSSDSSKQLREAGVDDCHVASFKSLSAKLEGGAMCVLTHLGPGPSVLVVLGEDKAFVLILVLGGG